MEFITLKNIEKTYKDGNNHVQAVKNINIKISQGDFVAVMGPSGSGKSTLLSVLGAITSPNNGDVIIDDINIFSLSDKIRADFRREYLGFVFQAYFLVPYLNALENVLLPLTFSGIKEVEGERMALEALEKVKLSDKTNRLPNQLSGGEQSRVAIARAVVNNPPIILADEPTGNLDTKTGEEIMGLFSTLNEEGLTIIYITHNPENVKYAKKVIELKDGEIINLKKKN